MTMTKREQDLKFLRKLIWVLKEEIRKSRENFVKNNSGTDFGKFCNKRVGQIDGELLVLIDKLERFEYGLNRNIENLEKYGYELE